MVICCVSSTISIYLPDLLGGRFAMLPIATGAFGIGLYCFVYFDNKRQKLQEQQALMDKQQEEELAKDASTAVTQTPQESVAVEQVSPTQENESGTALLEE